MEGPSRAISKRTAERKAKLEKLLAKQRSQRHDDCLTGKYRDPGDPGPCNRCHQWPIKKNAPPDQPFCGSCMRFIRNRIRREQTGIRSNDHMRKLQIGWLTAVVALQERQIAELSERAERNS